MDQVLLLHGFNKNARDVQQLASNLESLTFQCRSITLPLTRQEFDQSFQLVMEEIEKMSSRQNGGIHLVGHSTGGLLIRKVLTDSDASKKIGRCVQIATPNQGSQLATIAGSIKGYTGWFRTLKSLDASYIQKLRLSNEQGIEVGAIAGTHNNLWLGKLLKGENDGRVEVASVDIPDLTDFTTLHYGHKEIHYQYETAVLTARFLKTGSFSLETGRREKS